MQPGPVWPGQGGGGVRVTGRGEVRAEGAGPWGDGFIVTGRGRAGAESAGPEVRTEDAGLGSDAKSSGSEVGRGDLAGLAVEAGLGGVQVCIYTRSYARI